MFYTFPFHVRKIPVKENRDAMLYKELPFRTFSHRIQANSTQNSSRLETVSTNNVLNES